MATRERETKSLVPRSFRVPPAHSLAKRIAAGETDSVRQHAVYYDTADLRLTRSGVSLRYRSDDGWTVKLPESRNARAVVRTEHSFGGHEAGPPAAALSLVRAWTRTEPVIAVASIDTRRRRTTTFDAGGRPLAEIDDDDVIGHLAREPEVRFREIEVELTEGAPRSLLREVTRALRRAGARPAPAPLQTKIQRVLGARADRTPDVPREQALDRRSTVGDLVRSTVARSLTQLISSDPALRISGDADAVHQARVATRRLRSDLRTFRAVVEPTWSEPLRGELRWLGGEFGRVRDADVLSAGLARKTASLPDGQRNVPDALASRLGEARCRHLDALRVALDSERYARLLDALVDAAVDPRFRRGFANRRGGRVARRLVARPRKRLRRRVAKLGPDPSYRDLHEVRKRAKQSRYAHEAVAPILGKPARAAAERYEALQEVLGRHQDTVVASAWLLDAARDFDDRDIAFVAGEIAGLFLVDRAAARAQWPRVWERARKAKA